MAVTHTLGKLTGSYFTGFALDVFVHNEDSNDLTPIDLDDVVSEINGAGDIPSNIDGVPDDGDPQVRQFSATYWLVSIRYRPPGLRRITPPTTSQQRAGFNFHLPRKFVRWAPEIAKYPASIASMDGFINVKRTASGTGDAAGVWLEPPAPNLSKSLSVDPSVVTGSWVRGIAAIVGGGYVNSTALTSGAYAAGEVIITHITGALVSDTLFQIDIGWNWTQNVTGETRGEIENIAYDGQDYVWEFDDENVDRDSVIIAKRLKAVFVNRTRPRTDLSAIGIEPP